MKNIVIIGAGQLGSRHLQGIKSCNHKLSIFVLDTDSNALNIAQQRYEQIEENNYDKEVQYISDFNQLPQLVDIAIISTSSKPRASITTNLLDKRIVKYIIFEKFLFPSLSEYGLVKEALEKYSIKSWVNCPRRMFTYYEKIRDLLFRDSPISVSIKGGNWGLCCNSIHFIDLFSWISNENEFVYEMKLDPEPLLSKRNGYIEFSGSITLNTAKNDKLMLVSSSDFCKSPTITMTSLHHQLLINESLGQMVLDGNEYSIKVPYQSELSGIAVDSILKNGSAELATFDQSSKLHFDFLRNILCFYNNGNNDSCPIT